MDESVFRIIVSVGVGLACIAFVVQAVVVVALYRLARHTQRKVVPLAEKAAPVIDKLGPLADEAAPILANARQILEENRPRISEISIEAVAVAKSTRQQVEHVGEILKDATDRARVRIAQLDESVDLAVGQVEQVGGAVRRAVLRPVREVNAIMTAVSAGVAAYIYGRKYPVDHATQDEEMFI